MAGVVRAIARLAADTGLIDEVVVMDSDSTDATAAVAARAGAAVHRARDVVPELGGWPGKGEALWKSLLVTNGDLLVFVDADLTHWGPHFVTGLLGPLLADPQVLLVKGFYERLYVAGDGSVTADGGRVTELVARPLLSLWWPELTGVVQPLAGEWAIRRELMESLSVPVGYGVELAVAARHRRRARPRRRRPGRPGQPRAQAPGQPRPGRDGSGAAGGGRAPPGRNPCSSDRCRRPAMSRRPVASRGHRPVERRAAAVRPRRRRDATALAIGPGRRAPARPIGQDRARERAGDRAALTAPFSECGNNIPQFGNVLITPDPTAMVLIVNYLESPSASPTCLGRDGHAVSCRLSGDRIASCCFLLAPAR